MHDTSFIYKFRKFLLCFALKIPAERRPLHIGNRRCYIEGDFLLEVFSYIFVNIVNDDGVV